MREVTVNKTIYFNGYRVGLRNSILDELTEGRCFGSRLIRMICGERENGGFSKHPQDVFDLDGGTIGWPHFARQNFLEYLQFLKIKPKIPITRDIAKSFIRIYEADRKGTTNGQTVFYERKFIEPIKRICKTYDMTTERDFAACLRVANSYGVSGMQRRLENLKTVADKGQTLLAWYGGQRRNYLARVEYIVEKFDDTPLNQFSLPLFAT